MPETEEEKKKRWAKSRAMSYMTPAMVHAMQMSKYQSQNKYKEQFNKTKGKGYTSVTNTPELEHVRQQSIRASQNKYKSEFEKNKAKFTQVSDDPETLRVKRVTNQVSKIAYSGKGTAIAESRYKRDRPSAAKQVAEPESVKPDPTETADEVPTSHGRPLEVEETIEEEAEPAAKENGDSPPEEPSYSYGQEENTSYNYEASGGYQEEDPAPAENGGSYEDQEEATQQQEDDAGGYETKEYPEAQEGEPERVEYSEGGLDDFYANLG